MTPAISAAPTATRPQGQKSIEEICRSIDAKATKALSDVRLKERELSMTGLKIEKPFDPTFGIPRSKKLRDKIGPAFPASNTQRRACLSEISRLDGLLTEHRTKISNAKTAEASVARHQAAAKAAAPPKSKKEIANAHWDVYRSLSPAAKNTYYAAHKTEMDI
jgi:hypothetical protein